MTGLNAGHPPSPALRRFRHVVFAVATLAALLLTGCKQSPTAEQVRLELEQQLPGARFERESHLHLGRLSMAAVKQVLRFTLPKESEERKLIASIKRVDVATYRIVSPPENATLRGTSVLRRRLEKEGWIVALREQESDERTWVIYREDTRGAVRSLCVVSLDPWELEVVAVDGRLDELFAQAIADDPDGFVQSLGP